jgi:hypothetical protein
VADVDMSSGSIDEVAVPSDGAAPVDRRPDTECWAFAVEFLTNVIGTPPDGLWWDTCHPLRGRLSVRGLEFVVIAPRDTQHKSLVLTAFDWDEIHRLCSHERSALLVERAITNHERLEAVLARNDPVPSAA